MKQRVALATANQGKRQEFASLLQDVGWELVLPESNVVDSIVEDGKTFVENALIKARTVAKATQLPALADDSGLVVPSLNGEPGIYSARYAGELKDDTQNYQKLLKNLKDFRTPELRQAHFICVLVYLGHESDPVPEIGIGRWHGHISEKPTGSSGFGYDPVFYLPELNCTVAELTEDEKNRRSHRALAWNALQKQLAQNQG